MEVIPLIIGARCCKVFFWSKRNYGVPVRNSCSPPCVEHAPDHLGFSNFANEVITSFLATKVQNVGNFLGAGCHSYLLILR